MEGLNPAVTSPKREEEEQDHCGALDPSGSPTGSGLESIWGVGDDETIGWDFTALDIHDESPGTHGGDEMEMEELAGGGNNAGFWEVEKGRSSNLSLQLNYQEVMDAWSGQGPLWAKEYSCSVAGGADNACHAGEVPIMEEERERRRARVLKYREKRQSRLFAKKIRYQVRKLNADKRPRFKGRFVKRLPDERFREEKEPPHYCSSKMK